MVADVLQVAGSATHITCHTPSTDLFAHSCLSFRLSGWQRALRRQEDSCRTGENRVTLME